MTETIDIPLIVGILVTMLLSAYFSGMEIAFVSSNRMLAEVDKGRYGFSQRFISIFYNHPNGFVSTMLVGNNIVLVVYGILIARLFDNTIFRGLDPAFTVPADTLLSTFVILFTGEFLPKTLFKSNPNTLLAVFALPAYVFLYHALAHRPVGHLPLEDVLALFGYSHGTGKRRRGILQSRP